MSSEEQLRKTLAEEKRILAKYENGKGQFPEQARLQMIARTKASIASIERRLNT